MVSLVQETAFSEGENIPLPVKSGGFFTPFNLTPPLRDITEKSLTTGYSNPAVLQEHRLTIMMNILGVVLLRKL